MFEERCYGGVRRSRGGSECVQLRGLEERLIFGNSSREVSGTELHLFVLVHGFQACSDDMRLLRNVIMAHVDKACVLCSRINETDTQADLFVMGRKLANEVLTHIRQ